MRPVAILLASALVAGALAGSAQAQPAGGTVVFGTASISLPNPRTTLINQTTNAAIINWQNFSLSSGSSVVFDQPNATAIVLNRVLGGGASFINGNIQANGQVWIINSNGILFGTGSQINVAGLLATTSDIKDSDFAAGRYNASIGSPNAGATVDNAGTIHVASGGSAILSGQHVSNEGLIEASGGQIVLSGASTFTVDFDGDNLLRYEIITPITNTPIDANGTARGEIVSNSGTLNAPGGRILLTARAAANVADNVINNSGMITATSAAVRNGEVILDAGDGMVETSGTIDATGNGAGQTGGTVALAASTVKVADNATINASGDQGGGTVSIGGGLHGSGPYPAAQSTSVGSAAIHADANTGGSGGTIAVWSTGQTNFNGIATARGGSLGGNGGTVETSGHTLSVGSTAMVNTAALNGTSGDWLLDPTFLTVDSTSSNVCGLPCVSYGSSSTSISAATVNASLGTSNVTLQAIDDITVNAAIDGSGTGHTLEMDAGRAIILNANVDVTGNGGTLILSARNPASPASDIGPATISGAGTISADFIQLITGRQDGSGVGSSGSYLNIGAGQVSITTPGSSVYVQGTSPSVGLTLSTSNLAAGSLHATSPGDLTIVAGATITSSATGDAIVLSAAQNFINNSGSTALAPTKGRFLVYSAGPSGDVFGNLDSGNDAIWSTSFSTPIAAAGNRYVFALTPTLTFTSTDLAKTYGQDASGPLASAFTASGVENSLAGAYTVDITLGPYSGAPSVTSVGSAVGASVGSYGIAIAMGGLSIPSGYAVSFVASGQLTVNPAALTVIANDGSKTYGQTVAFTGTEFTTSPLQNGETVGSVTLASAGAVNTAGVSGSPYAIVANAATGGTFTASNYAITYDPGSLTVNPAALTVSADHQSKVYGASDPSLTYMASGFQLSDSAASILSGGLSRAPGENVGSYAISQGSLAANSNYSIVFAGNTLGITPATLTYVANSASRTYGTANPAFGGTVTGFVHGDAQATATSGAASFGTVATASSNVGNYAITGTGLNANNGNYVFVQASANATALTITPATLTYVADPVSRSFGIANPVFSGAVTGFVNGETQATATTGGLTFVSPATIATAPGSYAINGTGLSANNGNYVFAQAATNPAALTITVPDNGALPVLYLSWQFGRGGERPTDQDSLLFVFTTTDGVGAEFLVLTGPGGVNLPNVDSAVASGPIAELTFNGTAYFETFTSADRLSGSLSHYFENGSLFDGNYSSWGNEALWY